jgi:hypothetical protein
MENVVIRDKSIRQSNTCTISRLGLSSSRTLDDNINFVDQLFNQSVRPPDDPPLQ